MKRWIISLKTNSISVNEDSLTAGAKNIKNNYMNSENSHNIGNGMVLSCLCGKHKDDSKCEVFLRNHWRFCDIENVHEVLIDEARKLVLEQEIKDKGEGGKYMFLPAYNN